MTVFEIERDNRGTYGLKLQTAEVVMEALWRYPSHRAAEWAADDFMMGLALVYLYTHSLASQMEGEDSIELEVYQSRYEGVGFTITSGGVALESVGTLPSHSNAHAAAHGYMVQVATDYLSTKSMGARLTKGNELP